MEWISIKDRLPIEGVLCAIAVPDMGVLTATYEGLEIDKPRFVTTWGRGTIDATYWMQLPQLPNPEEINKTTSGIMGKDAYIARCSECFNTIYE